MEELIHKGDTTFANMEKVNSELLTMTYGALVMHLIEDIGDLHEVNKKLDQMGYNMGQRLTDELLAKARISHCQNFEHTAQVIAKVAFKMFFGTEAEVRDWSEERNSFVLRLLSNPLCDFVELPNDFDELIFCNLYCGLIRGALEMVNLRVHVEYINDSLKASGSEFDELRVTLEEVLDPIFREET